jgi:hemoglobin
MSNEGETSPEVPATPDDGEEKTPLFDRLGGAAALDAAVELLFAKILDDELLAPVFADVDMDQQKRMLSTFLSMVTGGPPEYDGRSVKDAHSGLGITPAQFDAVAAHLSDALIELEVSVEDHDELLVVAASTKDDIVDSGKAVNGNAADDEGHTTGSEINVNSFNELALPTVQIEAIRNTLNMVISAAPSRDAAADTFYQTIFDASRIIQPYFVSPRAVQALKFVQGIAGDLAVLDDPPQLKILLETRSFGHLALPVSVPLVIKVRDAIMDLFSVELGDKFTSVAKIGWNAYLNYVGGAYIYVKVNYAERLGLIRESWSIANGSNDDKAGEGIKDAQSSMMSAEGSMALDLTKKDEKEGKGNADVGVQNVPKTYPDMFKWNAVVTGLSGSLAWMAEVVDSFHNVVTNIANGKRLEEECDFLTIRICRTATGKINLADYKGCMLASLRSLLPNQWTNKHEFAWSWLWDNVERLLTKDMGKPSNVFV